MRWRALLVALAACGCLGADHVFPDESGKVVLVHANAYAKVGQDGVVEITGRDAQNVSRAFHGKLHMVLEEQHDPPEPPTYTLVRTFDANVAADAFSNPGDTPLHVETIPRNVFPEAGTYRLTLTVDVDGRGMAADPVLFYAEP